MANTNLRIINDDAFSRATPSASSTSGALAVTNLQTGKKSNVWRATGTSARVGATWSWPEPIQGVAAPFCNWSPTATWRIRLTSEGQATNLVTNSADFTAAAWVKTSVTVTANTFAAPDGTTTADTLTATAANAEIKQVLSATSGPFTGSIYIRRRTGSGAVSIRNSANTAWIPLTLTSALTRVSNDGGTTASPAVDILIATSGDAVDVWGAQVEAGATATSYYPTTSAAATRPLGYIDTWQSYAYDSGSVIACAAPAIILRGWTAAQSASAYAYGGGTAAELWLPAPVSAYGMAVDIADASNLQGYIEMAASLPCGLYWAPSYNASNLAATNVDQAAHTRTDAGDLWSDASTIHKKVAIELQYMPEADLSVLDDILRASRAYPIYLSYYPGNANPILVRRNSVYGKRMSDSEVAVQAAINYGTKLEVESI